MYSSYLWWRIHKVEGQQVLDAQRLEQQHGVGQVGALDLGHGGGEQLVLVLALRVQAEGAARARAARAARPLPRVGLAHRVDLPIICIYTIRTQFNSKSSNKSLLVNMYVVIVVTCYMSSNIRLSLHITSQAI